MDGKLIPETDAYAIRTGKMVCVSCNNWNCWHKPGELCHITGCECSYGNAGLDRP